LGPCATHQITLLSESQALGLLFNTFRVKLSLSGTRLHCGRKTNLEPAQAFMASDMVRKPSLCACCRADEVFRWPVSILPE
jgi:hypothetical protein